MLNYRTNEVIILKNIGITKQYNEPVWVVYQCSPSSEVRGRHNKGNPCYSWETRRTKYTRNEIRTMKNGVLQMKCPCGHRPRKNAGSLYLFDDEKDARAFAQSMRETERRDINGRLL